MPHIRNLLMFMICSHVFSGHMVDAADKLGHCPCSIDSTSKTADCHSQNLTMVPDCVPPTVKYLQLTRNNFVQLYRREFAKFKDLRKLDLTANKMAYLNDGCFQGLLQLTDLILWQNEITIIKSSSFVYLSNLQFFALSFNEIRNLSDFTFINNPKLLSLHLAMNKITHIGEHAFTGLSMLRYLFLSDNQLYFKDSLPKKVFSPLVSLTVLQLSRTCPSHPNNCTYFDQQISELSSLRQLCSGGLDNKVLGRGFELLKHLEDVYLGNDPYDYEPGCEMTKINSNTFESLRHTPLVTLSLTSCLTSNIQPYTFAHLNSLRTLQLRDNPLCDYYRVLKGMTFTSIKSLDLADTCKTRWFRLTSEAVENLSETQLEHLDWSNSNAVSINEEYPLDFWQSLPKSLKHLYLQNNKLRARATYFDNIACLENLETLDMSNQDIRTLGRSLNSSHVVSQDTTMHKNVDALSEQRSKHNATQCNLLKRTVVKGKGTTFLALPSKLRSLNISHSDLLPRFIPLLCNPNNSLEILNVSHHKPSTDVETLWGVMKNIGELEDLDLSNNKIKEIPAKLFTNNKQLRRVWLGDNSLLTVDLDMASSSNLEVIDLSYNSIQYVTKQFINGVDRIARHSNIKIYFQNNSFLCDCDHRDFVTWLRYTRTILEKDKLVCKYKNDSMVSLRYIEDIHNSLEAECIAFAVLISCTVGFVAITILSSLLAVIYYQRWNFNYLLRIGRRNINPYHPLEECQIEMVYDVYISYERDSIISDDETLHNFVAQELYPALVNRGFKVFIREELELGMRLYDLITSNLRRCEGVIVLLTKDYCKDFWNVFEFNMAAMEGIYTRRCVIIPVVLDVLNKEDLHEDVYTFLKDYTVAYVRPDNLRTVLTPYLIDRLK